MKLGKKKIILVKMFIVMFLMIFIFISTISYLYLYNNISSEEYLKLLMSDSYGNNLYTYIVEIISNKLNPLKLIDIEVNNRKYDLSNRIVDSPIIYIYNKNTTVTYKTEYNNYNNAELSSYYLCENLNDVNVSCLFLNSDINSFALNNNISIDETINLFKSNALNNYKSIEYIIELGIDNINDKIRYEDKNYALISFYANKDNILVISKLNSILNKYIDGISKIYYVDEYDNTIKVNIGTKNSNMSDVVRSIKLLSDSFKEVIYE